MTPDTEYLLKRASEEARRTIASEKPQAATVHEALSNSYSAKAVTLLEEGDVASERGETTPMRGTGTIL